MKKIVFIDLFCGAGGFTSGVEDAMFNNKKVAKVVACVNHDPLAMMYQGLTKEPKLIPYNQ